MQNELTQTRNEQKDKQTALLLIILATVLYAISYVGRKSYDANINEAMTFFGVGKSTAGIVGTMFFISYGAGQVIHGLLCSKYNFKYSIFAALIIGGVCNLTVALLPSSAFGAIKYIWILNGFSQASLWSSIVLIFNSILAKRYSGLALFIMCFPVSIGTFIGYGLSAWFSAVGNFKLTFYVAAVLLFAVGIFWFIVYTPLKIKCQEAKKYYDDLDGVNIDKTEGGEQKHGATSVFWAIFGIMCLLAVVDNFVKDGLTTWVPTFLKEKYKLENWLSVLLTLFLPVCALFGSSIALALNKKFKNHFFISGILFCGAIVAMGIMLACLNLNTFVVSLACFALTACLMAGVNNVVTAIYPMGIRNAKVNAGLVAGLVDGFCYVGSALSTYAFGTIAENSGWNTVMWVIFYFLVAATVICFASLIALNLKKQKKN